VRYSLGYQTGSAKIRWRGQKSQRGAVAHALKQILDHSVKAVEVQDINKMAALKRPNIRLLPRV
jgi:hypothetical protein